MGKSCSFFGHRKIEQTAELIEKLDTLIETLIVQKGVTTFLFGSRSEFDTLCHNRVTLLQEKYPQIQRIMYPCRSEYVVKKGEKERLEKGFSELLKRNVAFQEYDGEVVLDRVMRAGKASYIERNQEMINASEYCIFYYNPQYQPPKRKYSKRDLTEYQAKSGTGLAFAYAKGKAHLLGVFNLCEIATQTTFARNDELPVKQSVDNAL